MGLCGRRVKTKTNHKKNKIKKFRGIENSLRPIVRSIEHTQKKIIKIGQAISEEFGYKHCDK